MTAPVWAPTLVHVADYVPGRTLAATGGGNALLATFDGTTVPTGTQVEQLIADACTWVLLVASPLDSTLEVAAATCAAIYTAGCVERGYPERQSANRQDANSTADDLFKQAEAMRRDLALANEKLSGTDPADPNAALLPVWSFPSPAAYGDTTF